MCPEVVVLSLGSKALDMPITTLYGVVCLAKENYTCVVCNFRLRGSSALLPGGLLEGLLESMLEKSIRSAVARSKSGVRESAQLERSSSKNHKLHEEEGRWIFLSPRQFSFPARSLLHRIIGGRPSRGRRACPMLSDYAPATSRMRRGLKCA